MIIKKNPHDAFFKEFFGAPRPLRHLLEQVLPAELFRQIDLTTLRIEPGSYLDKEGRRFFSDLAASARLGGRRTTVYILIEHKSAKDAWVHLQLAGYMNRIWKKEAAGGDKGGVYYLSPILPILFYHGRKRTINPAFQSLFAPGLDRGLARHNVSFDLVVYNLTGKAEEEIRGPLDIQVALLSLKYARDNLGRLLNCLGRILRRPAGGIFLGSGAYRLIEMYILSASPLTYGEIREKIEKEVTEPVMKEVVMVSTAQQLLNKGMEEGIDLGRQEGRQGLLREVAGRLREKGSSAEEIAEILGLTVMEAQGLLEE